MRFTKIFVFIFFLGLVSCRTAVDPSQPEVNDVNTAPIAENGTAGQVTVPIESGGNYAKNGLSFILRKNWKVTEDENLGNGVRYISVEDDKTATIAITLLPVGTNPLLKKYADEFLDAMKNNLSGGTLTQTGESEVARHAANIEKRGIAKKFTISITGQDIPHTAELFLNKARKYDAVIIYNAPDDEKSTADAGFETILYTLKNE